MPVVKVCTEDNLGNMRSLGNGFYRKTFKKYIFSILDHFSASADLANISYLNLE